MTRSPRHIPVALTIAGSDSGGGAGIQADLRAFAALGVHGVVEVDPSFVALQIEVVVSDIGVDATKTGMLASPEIVEVVAASIQQHGLTPLVVDPVMVAKSGD